MSLGPPRWPGVLGGLSLALVLALMAALAACTSSGSSAPPEHALVTVTPASSAADQAAHITVTGLRPGQRATVQVSSVDSRGVRWQSADAYRASPAGVVDVDRSAPVSGSCQGVSGMGPIWSMTPASPASDQGQGFYFWSRKPAMFTATVAVSGARPAQTSFTRARCPRRRTPSRPSH